MDFGETTLLDTDDKEFRQYICLDCKNFWFVGELAQTRTSVPSGIDDVDENIPISICPKCRGNIHYCGSHKGRGSAHLFGERIAHLEYTATKVERSIKEGRRLVRGNSPNLLFVEAKAGR